MGAMEAGVDRGLSFGELSVFAQYLCMSVQGLWEVCLFCPWTTGLLLPVHTGCSENVVVDGASCAVTSTQYVPSSKSNCNWQTVACCEPGPGRYWPQQPCFTGTLPTLATPARLGCLLWERGCCAAAGGGSFDFLHASAVPCHKFGRK